MPYSTLVIQAGYLDEALLGLSAEPLVYGALAPQVRSMLTPLITMTDIATGRTFSLANWLQRLFGALFRISLSVVVGVTGPIRRAWERRLTGQLLKVIASPAMGISPHEFSEAVILAQTNIGVPDIFDERVWDATEELLKAPPRPAPPGETAEERYRFLIDPVERRKKMEGSWIWKQLQASMSDIERRFGTVSRIHLPSFKEQLLTTSLVLEERMRELIGATELIHSSYYTNPVITEGIADFIAAYEPSKATLEPSSQPSSN